MKNKMIGIVFCIGIICGVVVGLNRNEQENQEIENNQIVENIANTASANSENNIINNTKTESEKKMISDIKIIINGKTYNAKLEDNETAKAFINLLPQEFNMNELNGNEKYIYLDNTLPTNSYNPKHIEAGDIMLYGNNCLVVFYKSFETSYSYTKIGHIDNLSDLGTKNITIKFEK